MAIETTKRTQQRKHPLAAGSEKERDRLAAVPEEPTPFHSVLYKEPAPAPDGIEPPAFFADLHLDQIVKTITIGRSQYRLEPFFYAPLHDVDAIKYRQEVMRDLDDKELFGLVTAFAHKLDTMRGYLSQAEKFYYKYQKERLFLDAADLYREAVGTLWRGLSETAIRSRGFLGFREFLSGYAQSQDFTALVADIHQLKTELASVQYTFLIKGNRVTVRKYEGEKDFTADIEETFERFRQRSVKDYRVTLPDRLEMNHVEAKILDLVAELYPEVFSRLDAFRSDHDHFEDETISRFDREIEFYVAYLEHTARFIERGLSFCIPSISTSKGVQAYDAFDLALADVLATKNENIVCNDFSLKGQERVIIVTGPNQGGKTTFARMFGQMLFLGSLGCPVPGRDAKLFLFDRLLTHFEKEEDIRDLSGKLQDDLVRMRDIFAHTTPESVIIINEIFTSTTAQDALFLSRKIMQDILRKGCLVVWVTFVEELAALGETVVSMVGTVDPEDPVVRTFRIERRPADGLAYAKAIAEKYRLTYNQLKERIRT